MPQPPQQEQRTRCRRRQDFLMKNVLPIGFFVVLVWALLWPLPGERASKPEVQGFRVVSTINILVIFIISGLTLKTDDIANSSAWLGSTYGVFAILVLTPCAGFAAAELPFEDHEFSYGLAVFCVVPTTLTSGVTLVMQAGGNDVLALLLTVTTNLLGVVTVPFFVKAVVGARGANIDAVGLLVKLVIMVLIPLIVGKLVREVTPGAKAWIKKYKKRLSLTSSLMLIMVVWQTLSRAKDDLTSVTFEQIISVIAAGIALHILYLCVNYTLCTMLGLGRREFKAAVLMSSQKTLSVPVTVISFLGSLGQEGLMTLPCIVGHMSQLFIDAYISSRWAAEDQRQNSRVASAPEDDADKGNTKDTMGSTPEATGHDSQEAAQV